jgi:DNA-binding response OmpR family regulator
MLNLSRIEEGGVAMHYVRDDLVAFTRYTVNSFQGYADSRKINLNFRSLIPQLFMDIDPEKLEESLSNLLSNAIKYTPAGGEVFVTIRPLACDKADTAISESQVEICVRDTGIGISEEHRDKIFIRFYRVEDQRYPYQEGSGIGLTLVSEYLKMMNGSITVKSRPDEGSEFIVVLPVTRKADIGDVMPAKSTNLLRETPIISKSGINDCSTNQRSLLIIEDNRDLSEYLAGLLGDDYYIMKANNGIKGVNQAIEHIPDIILSDVMMPGKDGFQVCQELKNDFRTNHIPIVLLTAMADTSSRITGMEHGADAYLTKPFDKKELMVCLQKLILQGEVLRLKFRNSIFDKKTHEYETGLNETFLTRLMRLLEKNYDNDSYGTVNLYRDMKISRVQLHRKLRALTGHSASNFIRNFRLQKARTLLLDTEKPVTDIAYEVGFADANYFTKAFILEYGMAASELRKSFRQ